MAKNKKTSVLTCEAGELIYESLNDSLVFEGVGELTYEYKGNKHLSVKEPDESNTVWEIIIPREAISNDGSNNGLNDGQIGFVTSIGDYAFRTYNNIKSVVIPDSVTSIGDYAFWTCPNLERVVIGDSVTSIGSHAFSYCAKITSVKIPDNVTSIGTWAFNSCPKLEIVVIGDSVTSIGDEAFNSCSALTSVVIGDSVTSIGENAFLNCSKISKVYYKGSASDWSAISIGSSNSYLTNATRYYYSETEPAKGDTGNYWHYDENGNAEAW